jgi:predicted component of type VI protein secretion system
MKLVDPEPLDDMGKLWRSMMTLMRSSPLSQAEKLGILEFVKHEILNDMLSAKITGGE